MKQEAEELSTRDHIIQAADHLFYERGFEKTSFADIAEKVKISRGNFYYHFKSKDDILAAVIDLRAAKTAAMLDSWAQKASTPLARLRCFAELLIQNRKNIQRFGCPVGTLCAELSKLDHPSQGNAGMIFGQFRSWLCDQFEALGHGPDADALAMHLLSRSQGIASLANAFHDERFIRHEVQLIEEWLEALPVKSASGRGRRAVS
ncbi:MAG TPA: TetR/AcrR family transcriptional regulator [Roseateles sp.]